MASGKSFADEEVVIDRVAVSGATLSLLMQAFSSSEGDCDGLLFGHVQRQSTLNLVDDEIGGRQAPKDELTASVTGHCCTGRVMSFYDGAGSIDASKLTKMVGERNGRGGDAPIGWFVGRRETPLRPSIRESAVTANLRRMSAAVASSPCLFLLFSESFSSNATTQTHEYRAFQYRPKAAASGGGGGWFEPRTIHIVNIGPAFRGSYDSFAPVAPFPWFLRPVETGVFGLENNSSLGFSSEQEEEGDLRRRRRRNSQSKDEMTGDVIINNRQEVEILGSHRREAEQALLDMYSQDFSIDRLQNLIRSGGKGGQVQELEDLYMKMLKKLENLAKQVCESSDVLLEKEAANLKLQAALTSP